jgi:predicted metal-dependent hydrolase
LYGKQVPVFIASSGNGFEFTNGKVKVGSRTGQDIDKLNQEYEKFCKLELRKIVDKQIQKLRHKKVKVKLDFIQGNKKIQKDEFLSVNDYLDRFGYSRDIKIEIGVADKEWGINSIDPKNKQFTLFFNQSLIKYDSGRHIEYVVAHELTHIFHRHHQQEFHNTLARLYTRKQDSENFFSNRISYLFKKNGTSSGISFIVLAILAAIVIISSFRYLSTFIDQLFIPQTRF